MADSTVKIKVLWGGWSLHPIQWRIQGGWHDEENIDH